MANLNLQVNTIAYQDINVSNQPQIRAFDLSYKLTASIGKPMSQSLSIGAGETVSVFNGTRNTSIDNTTSLNVTLPDLNKAIYRISHNSGTAPQFRALRAIAIDNTSQFTVSLNGPISTYTSSGGTAPDLSTVAVGDILKIDSGSGFSAINQGRFVIVAKTTNSVSVQNLNAGAETAIIASTSLFQIYSNGVSANQPQIGDKVMLSAGFSVASLGTYLITEVTPSYIEISIGAANGIPTESNIVPTTSGITFFSSSKRFIIITAQERCAIRVNGDTSDNSIVEPLEYGNPEKPGLYVKQGTTYALSIKNLGLTTLEVLVASAE